MVIPQRCCDYRYTLIVLKWNNQAYQSTSIKHAVLLATRVATVKMATTLAD
ncbi:hypothetical protein [Proteus mirabilis]|uniref:hypothetical protein n=1 Tax=Proteus mirabilis TaxID=584 RepID=UPI0015F1683A|nr:hypothetical protein [Proteus mirabilis]EKU6779600.1 hypothetical protein [Proteus mirabilis]EKU7262706.1 hypothetical protein [Proteus mirabilis]EKU8089788.1 hypothetical protein [Proteus mirabilis]EKV5076696.1 hypothetical protein [Proteus mirabilis]EKX3824588.1 hypothetical protein [Proteus mirabilis]